MLYVYFIITVIEIRNILGLEPNHYALKFFPFLWVYLQVFPSLSYVTRQFPDTTCLWLVRHHDDEQDFDSGQTSLFAKTWIL